MPCGPRLGRLRTFLLGRRGCKVQEETRYNHSSIAKLAVAEECLASAFRPQTFSRARHCGAEDGHDEIDCLMGTSPPIGGRRGGNRNKCGTWPPGWNSDQSRRHWRSNNAVQTWSKIELGAGSNSN